LANPSNEEQLTLELINRIRMDPAGEYDRLMITSDPDIAGAVSFFGVDLPKLQSELAALAAVAPLAWSDGLAQAAQAHSDLMKSQDAQQHQLPGEAGVGDRITAAGYSWSSYGENIFAYAESMEHGHAGFVIDWGNEPDGMQTGRGHRANIMASGFVEVGIGHATDNDPATAVGPHLITHDFGSSFGYSAQFLGVVINDADGDSFYDLGEGLGSVTISLTGTAGNYSTTSWASGGWQISVPPGNYQLTFSGGGLPSAIVKMATLGTANVKVDAIYDPSAAGVPTAGNDNLVGTAGDDTIDGLAGNDVISGLGGNDTLEGGVGADRMVGGPGNDSYYVDNVGDTTIELSGEGTDTVFSSVNFELWAQSQHIENLTLIGGANLNGVGNALANTITGNSGNNVLNGGVGADRMVGGAGNDSYHVDNAGDTTIELSGQGTDTVFSSVNFELWAQSQHIENLTLIGGANLNGVGNALANTLTGNAGNNVLNGGVGADRMVGGAGNDSYHVDNAGDTTVEVAGQGTDTVFSSVNFELWAQSQFIENLTLTGGANLNGVGNSLANTLTGNAGNNLLNGGVGADRMVGGQGNDTYHVDNAGDTTIELAGQGSDSVFSSVSYLLWNQSQHIETLTLTGAGNIDGGGNGLANTITGNAGNNMLNGGGNADRMVGGLGDDTYYVDNFGDLTIELAGQGTDTVMASVGFALRDKSQFIENLTLDGTGHIYGTGNGLDNTITGNAGNNGLNGAWGNDTLIGGAGNDIFRDDAGNDIFTGGSGADTFFFLSAGESDRITDFENGIDTMTIGLGVTSFANITVTDSGADAILTFGTNTVTLENFDHALVSSDDFTFV
jgi:Ca2+-binding RTX toxin-like protein